jgi:hypothetical protein
MVLKQIIALLGCCAFFATQNAAPERKEARSPLSTIPSYASSLPKSVEYVGADRWVLYGIADCELHGFVDVDRKKNFERLYWVQFERYIPTRPELHHTYDSPEHVTIGGWIYVDTWARASDEKTETSSDLEHIDALIRAKG